MNFIFGEYKTNVKITNELPAIEKITDNLNHLIVADENTHPIAEKIRGSHQIPLCILKSGEENKNWQSVEKILSAALNAEIGRDGTFTGVGGGVIGDLTGFAASIYMRGCNLALVPTTLLAMVDASVGGKTGFDFSCLKNLAGTFYPAQNVYMPLNALRTLPQREWKSGFAELIKTAILDGDDFLDMLAEITPEELLNPEKLLENEIFLKCIEKACLYKGSIVSEDPREAGKRAILNLGHTFGHALEAAAGLGSISHGEAVAWGIYQACALGLELGITPRTRAKKITSLLLSFGYDCSSPHPVAASAAFNEALKSDKKKKQNKLTFIVPDEKSASIVTLQAKETEILEKIITKGYNFE